MAKTHHYSLNLNSLKTYTNSQLRQLFTYVCVSLCTTVVCSTVQHRTVLLIFPLILRTIVIARIISTGGEGETVAYVQAIKPKHGVRLVVVP